MGEILIFFIVLFVTYDVEERQKVEVFRREEKGSWFEIQKSETI